MEKLIIFGNGKIAEVIHYFFEQESDYEVVAFTADTKYIISEELMGKPVVPFETIQSLYPPNEFKAFVAVGYQQMNELRAQKITEVKDKGYELVSYVHPNSSIPKDLAIGENCFIMHNVNIHPRVTLGNNVFVWSGAMIGHHSQIGDNSWLTSCANISGNVKVGKNCFFAVNATTGHGIEIGEASFMGANALVTKSIAPETVVVAESDKPFRLNSKQFIRFSKFEDL